MALSQYCFKADVPRPATESVSEEAAILWLDDESNLSSKFCDRFTLKRGEEILNSFRCFAPFEKIFCFLSLIYGESPPSPT